MNPRTHFLVVALLALTACAGLRARERVMEPALKTAWTAVKADIEIGLAAAKEAGDLDDSQSAVLAQRLLDFDAALEAGDRVALTVLRSQWPTLREYAERGVTRRIQDGQISAGVSTSFLERHENFEQGLYRHTER